MKSRASGAKAKADKLFSLLVRQVGHCERCGKTSHLQCAHIISRRFSATRTLRDNAWCLCAGCHMEVDTHAGLKMLLAEQTIGEERYWELYHLAHGSTGKKDWTAEAARLAELVGEAA